jgi:hypothetical protein
MKNLVSIMLIVCSVCFDLKAQTVLYGSYAIDGDLSVGLFTPSITVGKGKKLHLRGTSDNNDPMFMYRYDSSSDISDLRLSIGDNVGGDRFLIGKQRILLMMYFNRFLLWKVQGK